MEQRKNGRIIIVPLPLQGHINPMMQLANILFFKGFSITIIHTTFNSLDPSKYPHFTFHPINENLLPTESSTSNVSAFLLLLNTKCTVPFKECLLKSVDEAKSNHESVCCLISDSVFHFTQEVADEFKIPRLVLRTGGATSTLVLALLPSFKGKGYLQKQESELDDPVTELPPLRIKDLSKNNVVDDHSHRHIINSMIKAMKASSGIIFNTFEELEPSSLSSCRDIFNVLTFPIGPFHKLSPPSPSSLLTQDQTSVSWLNKQTLKSVIYVSFGSIASINESQFIEIAWGLANSNQPFLWVIRAGLVDGVNQTGRVPEGFMEAVNGRGQIVEWAPQIEVLAHPAIGAFWTHNGWNSTMESISEGVPMICMPVFADQGVNARFVGDVWSVGLHLENDFDREKIKRTIERLMFEEEGETIRRRISCLKEKVNVCLDHGGSSWKSLDSLVTHILSLCRH